MNNPLSLHSFNIDLVIFLVYFKRVLECYLKMLLEVFCFSSNFPISIPRPFKMTSSKAATILPQKISNSLRPILKHPQTFKQLIRQSDGSTFRYVPFLLDYDYAAKT